MLSQEDSHLDPVVLDWVQVLPWTNLVLLVQEGLHACRTALYQVSVDWLLVTSCSIGQGCMEVCSTSSRDEVARIPMCRMSTFLCCFMRIDWHLTVVVDLVVSTQQVECRW